MFIQPYFKVVDLFDKFLLAKYKLKKYLLKEISLSYRKYYTVKLVLSISPRVFRFFLKKKLSVSIN